MAANKIYTEYCTTDIVLGATLKVHGFEIIRIDINRNKGTFVFGNVDDNIIQDFDLGRIKVEPTEFNNAIKSLTTSVRRMIK